MAKTPKLKPEAETADQAHAATPTDAETAAIQTAGVAVETLLVTGPKSGRRRAGRLFGAEPVTLVVDELAEAELAAIWADPLLRVTRVAAPY